MFTKMVVEGNDLVGSLTLQLGDVINGINIRDITGLDPVKATLTSSTFATQPGAIFQGSRRDTRNITLKLGIQPDPTSQTVRSIKKTIYSYFRPESERVLKFYVDDIDDTIEDGYQILGHVESCESPMFTDDPEVNISIVCYDPDFYDPIPVTVSGLTTADASPTVFNYIGTSETGIQITINVNRTVADIVLYYTGPDETTQTMEIASSFIAGDIITIDTTPGSKEANLVRAGVTTSMVYAISPQSVWPMLAEGVNNLKFSASGAGIPVSVTYTKLFGEL
jgi:hypothetical protein